jgi:hypothetical protein
MNKKSLALYGAVLEVLKAHGCISTYSIIGDDVNVNWEIDGSERVVQELIAGNPKPFGLKKNQRGILMLLLPPKEKKMLDDIIISDIRARCG